MASAKADSNGWFATSFRVPENASFGEHVVSASSNLDRCGVKPALLTVKRGYTLSVEANPDNLLADGVSNSTITVRVQDKSGNPVSGDTVIIGIEYAAPGSLEGSSSVQRVTGSDGTVTVVYTAPTVEEVDAYFGYHVHSFSVTISVLETIDGEKASTSITIGEEYLCSIETKPSLVAANGWDLVTVKATLKTPKGVPLQGKTVEFGLPTGMKFAIPDAQGDTVTRITSASGQAYVSYFAPTQEEYEDLFGDSPTAEVTAHVRFVISDYYSIDAEAKITISKKYVLTVEAEPDKLSLGDEEGASKITVKLLDEYGQPVKDKLVQFSIEPKVGRLEFDEKITEFDGKAIVKYISPTAEKFRQQYPSDTRCEVTITALVKDEFENSYVTSTKMTLNLKYVLTILTDPESLVADGKSESTILVSLKEELRPAAYKEVLLGFDPDFGSQSGLYYTNEHGIIQMRVRAPTLEEYVTAGLPESISVSAKYRDEGEEVEDSQGIDLNGLKIWVFYPNGAVIPWKKMCVGMSIGVMVYLADGTPVQNADVKIYGNEIGSPITESKTDENGVALMRWSHGTGLEPYLEPKMLNLHVVVSANIDGHVMVATQGFMMAIGASSNWVDNVPQEFWERVGNEIKDAIGAMPGLDDLPDWALTLESINQKIHTILDPNEKGSDKWSAVIGIVGDLSTQIADKAGLDLAWYVATKIDTIIQEWGANWVFIEDYFKWKDRKESLPPIPGNNGAENSPTGTLEFRCPINVLITDMSGNMIGNAAMSGTRNHLGNDMWLTAYFDEEGALEHQYFKLYCIADGLYLIRIVGIDNGAYSYRMTFEWLDRSFTVEDSGNINIGETQFKFILVNSSNYVPVRIFSKNETVQTCDSSGIVKNYFKPGETIYVFGRNLQTNKNFNLYIVNHSALAENAELSGLPVPIETDGEGNAGVTALMTDLDFGHYDIILDVNGDGLFSGAIDLTDPTGFYIVRTLIVPDDYQTIQSAVHAANCGDTIFIRSGIYNENVFFDFIGDSRLKRDLTITGEDKFTTVLNGTLSLWPQNPEGITISSLTINGGNGALHSAVPFTLTDCIVKDNVCIWSPFSSRHSFTIEDNIIEGELEFWPDGNVPLHNIIIKRNLFLNHGIALFGFYGSYANYIINNTIINAWIGIAEIAPYGNNSGFAENVISGNYIIGGRFAGIQCFAENINGWSNKQSRTKITGNTLVLNQHGIWVERVIGTQIWHNNFVNNDIQVGGDYAPNIWDGGYPGGGNYWSDYVGSDSFSGPYQNDTGSDGIGDAPYKLAIGGENVDRYPVMKQMADSTVKFYQIGVAPDFPGIVLTVDGQNYDVGDFPVELKWNNDQKHIFRYHSPLTVLDDLKQYSWNGTTGFSTKQSDIIVLSESGAITGNYGVQLGVTFNQSGLDDTAIGTVLTIDGVAKTKHDLPYSDWFTDGTTYNYENVVSSSIAKKRFKLVDVSGPPSPISEYGAIWGDYKVQYLLEVFTFPAGLTLQPNVDPFGEENSSGSWWYDSDEKVQLTAQTVEGYSFSHWEVDGISQGTGVDIINVSMNCPHKATAYYKATDQFYLTVDAFPSGLVSIKGEGWYRKNTSVTLTAPIGPIDYTDGYQYCFLMWLVDGFYSEENPITLLMDSNHTASALYLTPQTLKFAWSGNPAPTKGSTQTYAANYTVAANTDLNNVSVQGFINARASSIKIYLDDGIVDELSILKENIWTSYKNGTALPSGATLRLDSVKKNKIFTLIIPAMEMEENHTLSIVFDYKFNKKGTMEITGAWTATCTSKFGTLKTPYTEIIQVTVK